MKKQHLEVGRREFMRKSALGAAGLITLGVGGANTLSAPAARGAAASGTGTSGEGEVLYNGIRLPATWPPRDIDGSSIEVTPVPYLESPPDVIPIDVGRQLFVDDFLIERTDLKRQFHHPVKYAGNPILRPETEAEMNRGFCPCAVPFPDGCFYDPADRFFKMWYQAGWFDGTSLVVSRDGVHWERPELDVVDGTNLVVSAQNNFRRDGVTVWLDHETADPGERFKMYLFARQGEIGQLERMSSAGGFLLTSPDGIHWKWRGKIGRTGDNTTFYYNPFRKKWVFSVRTRPERNGRERPRSRAYWEHSDFYAVLDDWEGHRPVFWAGADEEDEKRENYPIGVWPEMYKIDGVAYESLMLKFLQIHYGPQNEECAKGGFPKLTEPKIAFSRDGFHLDRRARKSFIEGTLRKEDWDRAYVTQVGGGCLVVGDKLYIYYGAFQGDESNLHPANAWNGLYANGATGLSVLRRDGFASMNAGPEGGELTTRPLTFQGKHLFVNVDARGGELRCEVLDRDEKVVEPFTLDNSIPVSESSTLLKIGWKGADDLSRLRGDPVRFRFRLRSGKLYAFWVSPDKSGASHGYVAAGGPGFTGAKDTVGARSYDLASATFPRRSLDSWFATIRRL